MLNSFLADLHTDTALQLLVIVLPLLMLAHVVLEAIAEIAKGYFHWSQLGETLYDDFKKVVVVAFTAGIAAVGGVNPLVALDAEKVALIALGMGVLTECAQELERLTGWPIAIWQTLFDNLAAKMHLQDPQVTQPAREVPDATVVG